MANYGGFPSIDFSWLGELPGIAQQTSDAAKLRAARDSLSNLDPRDPKTLEIAAGRLISAGDLEGGAKLYGLATARRGVDQRGADTAAYNAFIQKMLMDKAGGGGGGVNLMDTLPPNQFGVEGSPPPAAPAPVSPAPATPPGNVPMTQQQAPLTPFPTSALPPPDVQQAVAAALPPVPPTAPGNINIPPQSPAAAQIAAALAPPPGVPPAAATALAGPVPQPDTGPPPAPPPSPLPNQPPPGFNPNFFQPPIDTTTPPGAPPPPAAGGPATLPIRLPGTSAAISDAQRNALLAPKGGSPSQNAALTQPLRDLSADNRLTPEQNNWRFDQLQRRAQGKPYQTFTDWQNTNKGFQARYDEFLKGFEAYKKEGDSAQKMAPMLETMDRISKDPAFVSGKDISLRDDNISRFQGVVQSLRQSGMVPEELLPRLDNLKTMKSTQLNELFTAVKNQLVVASLGGLGRQISDPDRNYMDAAYPSLSQTKQGLQLLIEFHKAAAEHSTGVYNLARAYRSSVGESRVNLSQLDDRVYQYNMEHQILTNPDGTRTSLGQRIDAELAKTDQPQTGQHLDTALQTAVDFAKRTGQLAAQGAVGAVRGTQGALNEADRIDQAVRGAVGGAVSAVGGKLGQGYDAFAQRLQDAYTAIKARGGSPGEILQAIPGGKFIQNDQTGEKYILDPRTGRTYPIKG